MSWKTFFLFLFDFNLSLLFTNCSLTIVCPTDRLINLFKKMRPSGVSTKYIKSLRMTTLTISLTLITLFCLFTTIHLLLLIQYNSLTTAFIQYNSLTTAYPILFTRYYSQYCSLITGHNIAHSLLLTILLTNYCS